MDLTIDITNYMQNDEIKDIIRDTIKEEVKKQTKDDYERILNNLAYYSSFGLVDSILTDKEKEMIKQKTHEIINNLSAFQVFYKSSGSYEMDSLGTKIMEKAVSDLTPVIRDKVKKIVDDEMNYKKLYEKTLEDSFNDAVVEKIGSILCRAAKDK